MLTQSATTGVLFATGDVLAQQGVEKRGLENHDFSRTARMGFYGGLIFGPMVVQWYRFLDRAIKIPGRANAELLARVAIDQVVFTPANMLLFFSAMAVLEGESPMEKLRTSFKETILVNWMVWPGVQLVNFKIVPLQHRLLVVNMISLGWNSYLSVANNKNNTVAEKAKGLTPE
ncbi:hypothetical protein DFH27DRAFT_161831 [Peziza echinospora]|nr:hypothetical protein DFH27DRAFT_161831 [Peziza echinospora]